jgi:hypothetical protein
MGFPGRSTKRVKTMSSHSNITFTASATMGDLVRGMSEGARQHLANHLYKHYGVKPQQLKEDPDGKRVNIEGVDYILVSDGV